VTAAGFQITVDCADPDSLARFWAEALRYELQEPPEPHESWREYWVSLGVPPAEAGEAGYDAIVDGARHGPRLWFQQVPEGKVVKNRMHLDLLVGGGRSVPLTQRRRRVDAEVERLVRLGASVRSVMDDPAAGHYAVGLTDPEGNEFDVV
jgi:hypothetical protein